MQIDLNCDVGECADLQPQMLEERVMPCVTSVSIACGFHAGNQDVMRRTIRLARAHGVAVGAHPSFRDAEGFGRREMRLTTEEIENLVAYQVGALAAVAALEGLSLAHVKPHGTLYNMAARDRPLADAIARAVATVDHRLVLYGLAGSALTEAGRTIGLTVAEEAFVDRAYHRDGSLVQRNVDGAVIHDEDEVVTRLRRLVRDHEVITAEGHTIRVHADTICLHGDTPGACRLIELIRRELVALGVRIQAVSHAEP